MSHAELGEKIRRRTVTEYGQAGQEISEIDIAQIDRGGNPRAKSGYDSESLQALAATIESVGLIHPIVVRKSGKRFQLIAGERRIRAHELLRRRSIQAVVVDRDHYDEQREMTARLVENLQRSDLTSGEYAVYIGDLIKLVGSQREVCRLTGLSKQQVSDYASHAEMIREMPDAIKITTSTAVEISRADEGREELLRAALKGGKRAEIRDTRSPAGRTHVHGVQESGRAEAALLRAKKELERGVSEDEMARVLAILAEIRKLVR